MGQSQMSRTCVNSAQQYGSFSKGKMSLEKSYLSPSAVPTSDIKMCPNQSYFTMLKQERYSPPTIMSSSPNNQPFYLKKYRWNTLLYAKGRERKETRVK